MSLFEIEERVAELKDLYEFATSLNELGFNFSTEDLEQEARELGVDLVTDATVSE